MTFLPTSGIPYSIHGIWFKPGRQYYICGAGMFNKKVINDSSSWKNLEITEVYTEAIRGNGINDITLCGNFGELLHYNGISWKSYQEQFSGIVLGKVAVKNNLNVVVGFDNSQAFIALGMRQ